MNHTTKTVLYLVGALLMAVPGLLTTSARFYFMTLMASGCLLLLIATVRQGFTSPKTALILLLVSNFSFWTSYALWRLRPKLIGPLAHGMDEPFGGPLALWFMLLLTFLVYEAAVFVTGLVTNRQRVLALVGLVALLAQLFTALRTIYVLGNGS